MSVIRRVGFLCAALFVFSLAGQAQEQATQQAIPTQQQVTEPAPRPKFKATGTPQQAIPTQESSNAIPDEQQASKEQIQELLDVMRVEDQLDDLVEDLPAAYAAEQKALGHSYDAQWATLSAAQKEQVEKLNKKYLDKFVGLYSVKEMMADLAQLYQNHLNNGDVESLINFFSTDAGQHLLDAQTDILKEFTTKVTEQLSKRGEALHAEQKKEQDALFASFKNAGKS